MVPDHYEEIADRQQWPEGEELLKLVKEHMGDHGLVGVWCGTSLLINNGHEVNRSL